MPFYTSTTPDASHDNQAWQETYHDRDAGYQATWSIDGSHTHHVTTNTADGTVVTLGHRDTADAQRAADGESLAAKVCGYGPSMEHDAKASSPAPVADPDVIAAVKLVVQKAHAKLPYHADRIDRAAEIVLDNGVTLLVNGAARVASQTTLDKSYHVTNRTCECRDHYAGAPAGLCKHRLAGAIHRRTIAVLGRIG